METKLCKRCVIEKPVSEFYVHKAMAGGYLNFCKGCTKKRVAEHREQNLDYIRWYDRQRANLPQRKAGRLKWWQDNPDKKGVYQPRHNARHPNQTKAKQMVNNAVRDGRLEWKPCAKCGDKNSQGHHEDYSKPLDVIWLCPKHHAARHRGIRDANRKNFNAMKHGRYKQCPAP